MRRSLRRRARGRGGRGAEGKRRERQPPEADAYRPDRGQPHHPRPEPVIRLQDQREKACGRRAGKRSGAAASDEPRARLASVMASSKEPVPARLLPVRRVLAAGGMAPPGPRAAAAARRCGAPDLPPLHPRDADQQNWSGVRTQRRLRLPSGEVRGVGAKRSGFPSPTRRKCLALGTGGDRARSGVGGACRTRAALTPSCGPPPCREDFLSLHSMSSRDSRASCRGGSRGKQRPFPELPVVGR
jgi:hypothetical protein